MDKRFSHILDLNISHIFLRENSTPRVLQMALTIRASSKHSVSFIFCSSLLQAIHHSVKPKMHNDGTRLRDSALKSSRRDTYQCFFSLPFCSEWELKYLFTVSCKKRTRKISYSLSLSLLANGKIFDNARSIMITRDAWSWSRLCIFIESMSSSFCCVT